MGQLQKTGLYPVPAVPSNRADLQSLQSGVAGETRVWGPGQAGWEADKIQGKGGKSASATGLFTMISVLPVPDPPSNQDCV